MFSYGLVFRHQDSVWLALYNEDGDIQDADTIADDEGIYDKLAPNAMSFVSAEVVDEVCTLRDLQTISIANEQYSDGEALGMLLKEGNVPDLAKEVWEQWGH